MKLEHKKVILISMFFLIVPFVLGANIIEQVFDSIGGNIDLGQTYLKYPALIDAIIYFILFIAISKSVFSKIDQFKDNNVIPIVIGSILAISMAVLSTQLRPPLRLLVDMGPYALILFIMVIAVFLFNFVKGMGATKLFAFSITFILLAGLFNFLLSPSVSGQSKASEPITKLQKQPMFSTSMVIMNIIAIFGLIGGIFSFVKFKSSGESDIYDANNLASTNDKDWNKFLDDAKKDEIDDLDATSKLGPEEQIENELTKAEENAEKAEINDLTAEEKNVKYIQDIVDKIVDSKNNMINAEKTALSMDEKTRVYNTSISYINNALAWLRAAFPKIAAEIEDEVKKESISETAEKNLKIEADKLESLIEKLRKYKDLESEVKNLEKEVAIQVIPVFETIKKEIDTVIAAQGTVNDESNKIKKSDVELINIIKKSQSTIQKIITQLNTNVKSVPYNGQTVLDIDLDKLQLLKNTVDNELKVYADGKLSIINEIEKLILARDELIKKQIQLDEKIVQDSRQAIIKTLKAEEIVLRKDMTIVINFFKYINDEIVRLSQVPITQTIAPHDGSAGIAGTQEKKEAIYKEIINKLQAINFDGVGEKTKKILDSYKDAIITAYSKLDKKDTADNAKNFEKKLSATRSGLNNIISRIEKRLQKFKVLEGAK